MNLLGFIMAFFQVNKKAWLLGVSTRHTSSYRVIVGMAH